MTGEHARESTSLGQSARDMLKPVQVKRIAQFAPKLMLTLTEGEGKEQGARRRGKEEGEKELASQASQVLSKSHFGFCIVFSSPSTDNVSK